MRKRLTRILIRFAIAIVIVLAFGGLFGLYTDTLPEAKQQEVLIKAIPFVAIFVAIVLVFICLVVVVAVGLEGKVPLRSYRPIEYLLIAGIILGVIGLFQGWKLFVYQFGFLVVLFSLLMFMIWSHLTPMPLRQSRAMPPISRTAHLIGITVALLVWALVTVYAISDNKPQSPYGLSPTLWAYKSDEEKAQIKSDADSQYQNYQIPGFAVMSLLPGALVYFSVREVAAAFQLKGKKRDSEVQPATNAGTPAFRGSP
jgi:magnesium-transporting ATPase (P-type)